MKAVSEIKPFRVLVVGHGSIGKRHVRLLLSQSSVSEIILLSSSADQFSMDSQIKVVRNLNDAIACGPDIAIIANPSPFHLAISMPLIEKGCHLLIEKPISDRSEGLDKLVEEAAKKGLIVQVGYNLRFFESLNFFRDSIKRGDIGRVLFVKAEVGQHLQSWRSNVDYRDTVSARKNLGGGVLLELSHEVDYLRWIFGDVSWLSAWSGKVSALDIDVEDIALLNICHVDSDQDGMSVMTTLSMDFVRKNTTRECTAFGEVGTLKWDGLTGSVFELIDEDGKWRRVIGPIDNEREQSFQTQWDHFLSCINTLRTPLTNALDAMQTLITIEHARVSAKGSGSPAYVGLTQP